MTMKIPTDYGGGYKKARDWNPELADLYLEHTHIGDPLADALVDELANLKPRESAEFLRAGMDLDETVLRDAPDIVREFFNQPEPEWLDLDAFRPGVRMFQRHSGLVLAGMLAGVLVEGFSTNISKSFFITGRLRDSGVRRLQQNNRHMIELFFPGGLTRFGDGWKLSVRIRIVHAQVRKLLKASDEWLEDEWGLPLSSAHTGFAVAAFSARLLHHLKPLGGKFSDEEAASFMAVWRYSGHLMGIPDTILYRDEAHALEIFKCGLLCEPHPTLEAQVMANALLNSAPIVAGTEDPEERRRIAKFAYSVSRGLIGNDLANALGYPKGPGLFGTSFGVLAWFRITERYQSMLDKIRPDRIRSGDRAKFATLFMVSNYDDTISYRLPSAIYAEESTAW